MWREFRDVKHPGSCLRKETCMKTLLVTVLAFMMAVTTLSLPSVIMLRKAVKPKLLALFVAVCAGGIIMIGYLFNLFQNLFI